LNIAESIPTSKRTSTCAATHQYRLLDVAGIIHHVARKHLDFDIGKADRLLPPSTMSIAYARAVKQDINKSAAIWEGYGEKVEPTPDSLRFVPMVNYSVIEW
jgi:hypothetical protein